MAIKSLSSLVTKRDNTRISPEKMPSGRYGFTITNVVLSNTDNDFAMYVNYVVRNDTVKAEQSVRFTPGIDSKLDWASIYSICNLLDTAKPGSSTQFEDMAADCIDLLDEDNTSDLEVAAERMHKYLTAILAGVNFTGEFVWNTSKTNGKKYFNLRTQNDDRKCTLDLDHVRETVDGEDLPEQERQPKRVLAKVKR